MTDLARLRDPFPRDRVSWRIQGTPIQRGGEWIGMALAYIDARDVMDRLDEVCGPEGWQSEISETASGRVLCTLSIRTESGWVRKTDGAGSTQVEAEKGGISDSLKRAAVQWGVGRYLYEMDAVWVPCEVSEKGGKTYWRKWKQDPWSRVRNAPAPAQHTKPAADVPKPQRPLADRLSEAISKIKRTDNLAQYDVVDGWVRSNWPDVTTHSDYLAAADVAKTKHDAAAEMAGFV